MALGHCGTVTSTQSLKCGLRFKSNSLSMLYEFEFRIQVTQAHEQKDFQKTG